MTRDIDTFLSKAGWGDAARSLVAGDASNRRYDRLTRANGETAILMDAPPEKGEDVRPFVEIANHLLACGLSAPKVLDRDDEQGFLVLEDLGDAIFARVLERTPALETEIYTAAVDVLIHLHAQTTPDVGEYNQQQMTQLAGLAYDWYQRGTVGRVSNKTQFVALFSKTLTPTANGPRVLIQRDYHAENLLWLPERAGVARVGLLDFQDALLGHPAYDLVSILQDARRDVPAELETAMIDHFLSQTGNARSAFVAAYDALSLQRNLRILGVFARLSMAYGKVHYVDLIPRVWGHIDRTLAKPEFAELAERLRADLPEPTPDNLQKLKDQCGQHQLL